MIVTVVANVLESCAACLGLPCCNKYPIPCIHLYVASSFPRATVARPLPWGVCQRRSFRELYDRYFDWLCPPSS